MGYTKARLNHALKVFRRARPTSRATRRRERTIRSSRAPLYQSWNFSGAPDDSDEDEYDPNEDRKRLKASRRRKKDETGKRKSTQYFITFKLTDSKSRSKLEELARGRNAREHRKSSSGEGISGGQRVRDETHDDAELSYKLMDSDDDVEFSGTLYGGLTQTALRSGRVLQKIENNSEDTIRSEDPRLPEDATIQEDQEAAPHLALPTNRSNIPIGSSFAEPISIDSSDDERFEERPTTLVQRNNNYNQASGGTVDSQHRSGRPSIAAQSTQRSWLSSSDSTIERFITSYAHPINFKFIPTKNGTSKCHFCTDWTMGVIGHLPTFVEAIRDRENPSAYRELRDGHQGQGKDPTQMCVRCALERLQIMRCHSPCYRTAAPNHSLSNPFDRIRAQEPEPQQSRDYLRHMFCRLKGELHLLNPTYQFPTCCLCPNPAMFKCARWQEQDHARRPCQVPKDRGIQARSNAAVPNRLSSSNSPQPHLRTAEPVVISLLDSSDEEDDSPSRPSTVQLSRAPQTQALRPPLRGCGLHLCATCHAFVTQECDGLLPEALVMRYLDHENKMGKRADVQWLFKGSLLEESYEQGARRTRRG